MRRLAAIVVAATTLCGCSREYTCTCTDANGAIFHQEEVRITRLIPGGGPPKDLVLFQEDCAMRDLDAMATGGSCQYSD